MSGTDQQARDPEAPRAKRISRQQRSCDACRTRKVRCDRTPPELSRPESFNKICSQCKALSIPCRFDVQPKKRGPPNLYVKRMAAQASEDTSAAQNTSTQVNHPSDTTSSAVQTAPNTQDITFDSLFDLVEYPTSNTPARLTLQTTSPTLSTIPTSQQFNDVLCRDIVHRTVRLYFDYVYPLIPVVHRPTLLSDIQRNREQDEGEEEWTNLVMSLVACTAAQVPHLLEDVPRQVVKHMVMKCYGKVRQFLGEDFEQCSLIRHATLYFMSITAELLGQQYVSRQYVGASIAMALQDGLHREGTYASLPPIEREVRRRIWWILYSSDRSTATIDPFPGLLINEDDCDTALPRELDDEYITDTGYLDQPSNIVPILSGYCYISRLYRLTGLILQKRAADRRNPPSGITLQLRLNEIDDLLEKVVGIMDRCPSELQLSVDAFPREDQIIDWSFSPYANVQQLVSGINTGHLPAKDTYLVQKSNIYVTQQLSRLLAVQYRHELLALQRESFNTALRGANIPVAVNNSSVHERDKITTDLLNILKAIPLRSLAVNTLPLVLKVRYVAATLLETSQVSSTSSFGDETSLASQRKLWSFLQTLSDIEALYTLEPPAQAQ